MQVNDLSYIETLTNSSSIYGGSQLDNHTIHIFLDEDGNLVLKLGNENLCSTKLSQAPRRFIFSLKGFPGLATSTRTENINGKVTTVLTIGQGKLTA